MQGKAPAAPGSTWLWWSGGKHSAWSLHILRQEAVGVTGLVAGIDTDSDRVAAHGVRRSLLHEQAAAVELPLHIMELQDGCSSAELKASVAPVLAEAENEGVEYIAFGDLADTRENRRRLLHGSGLQPLFPIYGHITGVLARRMIRDGLEAWVTTVDRSVLPPGAAGSRWDEDFLASLPKGADPCGVNGEFHTFVESAPGWQRAVPVRPGERVQRNGFIFADLLPERRSRSISSTIPWVAQPVVDPFRYFARLRRVRTYVDRNLSEGPSLPEVASIAAMNPSSFSRFFRRSVGLKFSVWLVSRRIRAARELFRDRNHDVSWVAREVGYNSDRSFRRAFKDQVGCCPSSFRKSLLRRSTSPPKRRATD